VVRGPCTYSTCTCDCCSGGGETTTTAGLVVVWRHFGACEICSASVPYYAVRIEVTVEIVASAAVPTPAE